MATPSAVSTSRTNYVDLPGVEGQQLEFRNNALLYSAYQFDAAALPSEAVIFNYGVGQNVSSNNSNTLRANNWHTNMRQPRVLPAPEVFVVDRVRVWTPPVRLNWSSNQNGEPAMDQNTSGTANVVLNNISDNQALNALHIRLEIEGKRYVDAPLYMCPANVGLSGIGVSAGAMTTAATTMVRSSVAVNSAGEGWRFSDSIAPIITSTTLIDWRFLGLHTTNPTLLSIRLVYGILQGTHGRAVR